MTTDARYPERVRIVEVGPRDGFQMEREFIPTRLKTEVIDLISASGVSKIEATSFVSPKAIPQLADSNEVMKAIRRRPGVLYSALVPNLEGIHRAIEASVDAARLVVCATETYNMRNVGLTINESLEACEAMLDVASDSNISVEAVIAVAFGCPFEGAVSEAAVVHLAQRFAALGIEELSIADSIGVASPVQMKRLMRALQSALPEARFSLHLHDTRGLGLANVLAALDVGIDTFDASIGGLGGCPVTTASTGNIATEDLAHMCAEMGIETGVDLDLVRRASRRMESFLDRPLPSRVLRAGSREELFAAAEGS